MGHKTNLLVQKKIIHKSYGIGVIEDIKIVENNDIKIFVSFTNDDNETIKKVFIAKLAFSSGSIRFLDEANSLILNDIFNELADKVSKYINESNSKLLTTNLIKQKELNIRNEHILICVDKIINKKNISVDLISLFNNSIFENELYEYGFNVLLDIINGKIKNDKNKYAVLILLLTYVSLKYYDGDLYSHIDRLFRINFPNNENLYTKKKIIKAIYEALDWYKPEVKYFDEKSYVAVPIVLCCVPHYRMDDLFRFSFDIYKKKMLYDEDLTDEQIQFKVLETLNALRTKELVGNSDSIKIKGSEYLMSKFTQSCIYSGKCIEDLTSVISHCIRLIIYFLTRHEDSFVVEEFYKNGYITFTKYFENNNKEQEKYQNRRSISRPYFKFENNNIYLVTGELGFDDFYNPQKLELVVFCAGVEEYRIKLNSLGDVEINEDDDIGGYKLNRKKILLKCNVLNNLSYSVVCDDVEIYNSKNRLSRTNIFFDKYGDEIKPGTEYTGTIRAITQYTNIESYGDDINEFQINESIYSCLVEVNNYEVFRFDNEPYIFYKISEPKIIGYSVPWADYISFEGKKFDIYKDMSIIFQAPCEVEDLIVNVNGINNDVCEMDENVNYDIFLFSRESNGLNAYKIKFYKLPDGLNEIKIINRKTSKIIKKCSFNFLLDSSIEKRFIQEDKNGTFYELYSSMIKSSIEIYYKFGCSLLKYDCFAKGIGIGKINIYPSTVTYSIDDVQWNDLFEKIYLPCINDKQKYVYICGPSNLISYYFDTFNKKQNLVVLIPDENDNMRYKLDIDCFRKSTFNGVKKIKIWFEFAKKRKYLSLQFIPDVDKENSKFYFNKKNKTHYFQIFFKGTTFVKCKISQTNSEIVFFNNVIKSGQLIEINESCLGNNTKYLTMSLYGRKYGSLLSSYSNEPFYTFPKYSINPFGVELIEKPIISYNKASDCIGSVIKYNGNSSLKVVISPSGFEKIIYEKYIISNERIECSVKNQIFASYNLLLYRLDRNGMYEDKPFYISRAIKTNSKFLNRHLLVNTLVFDTERKNVQYIFVSNHIIEFGKEHLLVGNIYHKDSMKLYIEDIYLKLNSFNEFVANASVYRIKNGKIYRLKTNGEKVLTHLLLSV